MSDLLLSHTYASTWTCLSGGRRWTALQDFRTQFVCHRFKFHCKLPADAPCLNGSLLESRAEDVLVQFLFLEKGIKQAVWWCACQVSEIRGVKLRNLAESGLQVRKRLSVMLSKQGGSFVPAVRYSVVKNLKQIFICYLFAIFGFSLLMLYDAVWVPNFFNCHYQALRHAAKHGCISRVMCATCALRLSIMLVMIWTVPNSPQPLFLKLIIHPIPSLFMTAVNVMQEYDAPYNRSRWLNRADLQRIGSYPQRAYPLIDFTIFFLLSIMCMKSIPHFFVTPFYVACLVSH